MKNIFVLLICGACLTACSHSEEEAKLEETTTPDTALASIKEDTVAVDGMTGATNVVNAPSFNGLIVLPPDHDVTITLTMGGSVHSLTMLPGQAVRHGEVIATLDNPEFIDLQQTYLDAVAQCEFLQKEYERQQVLAASDVASQKRLQQSKADYLSMLSRLRAAEARLKVLGVDVDALKGGDLQPYLSVKSPISGYVTNLEANVGKYFNAGEPICDIINKDVPLLQLTAYEKDLTHLHIGDSVRFRVNGMGEENFEAVLISIDQTVDDTNRSVKVYARVCRPDSRFRPGMYVNARFK